MNKCSGEIYSLHRFFPCRRNAKILEGDKWWCGIHAPSKIAEKRAALAAQRDEKYREREAQYAVEIRRHNLAIACEKAGIYTTDDLTKIIKVKE